MLTSAAGGGGAGGANAVCQTLIGRAPAPSVLSSAITAGSCVEVFMPPSVRRSFEDEEFGCSSVFSTARVFPGAATVVIPGSCSG